MSPLVIAADGLYKRDVFRMLNELSLFLCRKITDTCRLPRSLRCSHNQRRTDQDYDRQQTYIEPLLERELRLVCCPTID